MADGMNEKRAVRVTEIMMDFHTLQVAIRQLTRELEAAGPDPSSDSYYEEGYAILRRCDSEARAVLDAHFDVGSLGKSPDDNGDGEQQKAQLQRVILDASTRRFQAQKLFQQASLAMRWAQQRNAILRGQKPQHAQHLQALQASDQALFSELANITNNSIYANLRHADLRAGRWVDEDPSMTLIGLWMQGQR